MLKAKLVRQYQVVLPGVSPEAAEPIREVVRAHLRLWGKAELSFVAELGVTELLANVWKHTAGDCELLVRETPDGVVVAVTDFDDTLPEVQDAGQDEENGRGLFLLSAMAEELDVQPLLKGKRVWFRLRTAADGCQNDTAPREREQPRRWMAGSPAAPHGREPAVLTDPDAGGL